MATLVRSSAAARASPRASDRRAHPRAGHPGAHGARTDGRSVGLRLSPSTAARRTTARSAGCAGRRHRRRHTRSPRGPDAPRFVQPQRHRDHGPRRGRPPLRPRLLPRRRPAPEPPRRQTASGCCSRRRSTAMSTLIVRAHFPCTHSTSSTRPGRSPRWTHHVLVVGRLTTRCGRRRRCSRPTPARSCSPGPARRHRAGQGLTPQGRGGRRPARQPHPAGPGAQPRQVPSGKATVVVATDVAARGIHVDNVGLVVHYDAPAESKAYLHRSGRTARAGESGAVVTVSTPNQVNDVVRLHRSAGVVARHHDIHTAPSPLTADSLASAGTAAPAVTGKSSGVPKRRSSGGRKPPARSGVRGGTGQRRSSSGQSRRAGGHARSADAHRGRAPR